MLGSLIKSTLGVVTDVATVVVAPVAIAVDATRAVTKPVAEAVEDVAKEIHSSLTEDN